MKPRTHADVELLDKLLLGQLPLAETERLEVEYADDSRLTELAEALAGRGDTLLGSLRHHQTQADHHDDGLVDRLVQRLRKAGTPGDLTSAAGGVSPAGLSGPEPLPEGLEYFRIRSILGEGGMGTVYLADDTRLGRQVALKTLKRELAVKPAARDRFLREARSAARLVHDHIIPIYYVGEADGIPFLAMPLLQGEPLDRHLQRAKASGTRLPIPEVMAITQQLATGLASAHTQGLVHRDIKPANIWLETLGEPGASATGAFRVKILDFGLAQSQCEESHLTATGTIVGTPAYMAPEQARGLPVDHRADLFSLGCVLYEMLTDKRPFTGPDTMAILTSLAIDIPRVPHEVNPQCPAALSRLTMQLLSKQPDQRPASAQVVVDVLANLEARTTSATAVSSKPVAGTDSPTRAITVAQPAAPRRRRAALLVALLLALLPLGWWLGTVVLRVETANGNLVVEIDDAEVEARIKDGKLILTGPDGKVRYTLSPSERNKKVDAGSYRIRVEGADGLVLDTPEFTLEKGGRRTVRVTLEPKAAAKRLDPDRKAAEYVLSIGGRVRVNEQAAEYVLSDTHAYRVLDKGGDLKAAADLPRESFRLTSVLLTENTQVSDAGLANFKDCKNLRLLVLNHTQVSDAGLAHFKDCKNLTILDLLRSTKVGDAGLAHFKDCKHLTALELHGTKVSDAGLAHFKDCKHLTALFLAKTQVGDTGLANFKECMSLTMLSLKGTQISNAGLAHFKDRKNLRFLKLDNTIVSDAGLAHFKDCKNLRILGLSETQVSDVGLAHFKDCKHLQELWLYHTQVSDEGLTNFKDCKNLLALYLMSTQVSDVGLSHFQDCKGLMFLRLDGSTKVSDAGLAHFKDRKNLWELWLDGTQVSDTGLAHFKDCRSLRQLSLNNTQVSDAGLANFKDCKILTSLVLRKTKVTAVGIEAMKKALPQCKIDWDGGVIEPTVNLDADRKAAEYVLSIGGRVRINEQDAEVEPLLDIPLRGLDAAGDLKVAADLPREPFRLTSVMLSENKQVTDAGLALFKDCKNLRILALNETQVSDAGLAHFRDCKSLGWLDLASTKLSDAGLAHFKDCKNLTYLRLHATQVTALGMVHFKDCTNLKAIGLTQTKVNDAGLINFKNCKNLTQLYAEKVSDVGLAYFKDCKNLRELWLAETQLSEAGLVQVKSYQNLRVLALTGAKVNDAALPHLKECQNLWHVNLHQTQVSDTGLAHFKDCRSLRQLSLNNTQVSDAGLANFKDCKNLTSLDLRKTKVTAAGIAELKKALPQCKIDWDGMKDK